MDLKKIEIPVVIVGAGPAGAATSVFLSKKGIRHIVVEKAVFPRDKTCGDACSGRTTTVIELANPKWLAEMRAHAELFHPTWGMTVVAPNGKTIDIPYTAKKADQINPKGFTVPRLIMDNFLFEKMASPHCTIFQGITGLSIVKGGANVIVNFSVEGQQYAVTTPVIVGADGDKSMVRRHFMPQETTAKTEAIGLRAYYDGITGMHPDNFIELHYFPEIPDGYLWVFPLPGGRANVGVGMLSATVRAKKIKLRELMLHTIKNNPRLAGRFSNATLLDKVDGWGIPIYTKSQPFSGDNFLLVGDAALMIDPFSGEGVGNALYAGMLAADAIAKATDEENFSAAFFRDTYEKEFDKHLGPELRQNGSMQRIFKSQRVFNWVFNKAYKSPSLRKIISCMFTEAELQKQLSKPLFYLKVLLNR